MSNEKMHQAFVTDFCPYKGNPDPWVVWQAAWQAALAQQPQADEVTNAQRDVVAERARQVAVEGWTPEHDDETHGTEDLAFAASCYATADEGDAPPAVWPWHRLWWKPSDRRRNLVKAGALILAEIERLDRAAMQKDTQ